MATTEFYSSQEEKLNIISHAIGLVFSLFGWILLLIHAMQYGDIWHISSFGVFGLSLVILYTASTAYHSATEANLRKKLRIFDHASIYILIAGTYTPFALVTLHGKVGWIIFATTWSIALIGVVLKIFFTGKYDKASTVMYVLMGWIIIFAIKPLMNNLHPSGIFWLVAGGITYTIGAILYSIKQLKFNHAIFHLFVLAGSLCHFMAIYYYV